MFPVRGPAQKSRNWFRNFTAAAALVFFALPASAQSIIVTGVAHSDATVVEALAVSAGAPRSIVERYKAETPRPRGPLTLLVDAPQPSQTASTSTGIVADQVAQAPTRTLPVITVSTLNVPTTNR